MLQSQSLRIVGHGREAMAAAREGIRRAERVLALNPLDVRAMSLGAGTLFDLGEVDRAVAWAERAMALSPNDAGALFNGR